MLLRLVLFCAFIVFAPQSLFALSESTDTQVAVFGWGGGKHWSNLELDTSGEAPRYNRAQPHRSLGY